MTSDAPQTNNDQGEQATGYGHQEAELEQAGPAEPHRARRHQLGVSAGQAKRAKRTEIDADYVLTAIKDTIEQYRGGGEGSNPNAVLKGAELLGRHLAMFTDKAVVDLNHGLQEMDDDALAAHARQLADRLGVKLPKSLITPTGGKVR